MRTFTLCANLLYSTHSGRHCQGLVVNRFGSLLKIGQVFVAHMSYAELSQHVGFLLGRFLWVCIPYRVLADKEGEK